MTLQQIVQRLRRARASADVVATLLDTLGAFIGADGAGVYRFGDRLQLDWAGVDDAAVHRYQECIGSGGFSDPLLTAALEGSQAVGEQSFTRDTAWLALYREAARPFGYRHLAIAPLVVFDGRMAAISCLRAGGTRTFSQRDLLRMMSVSLWCSSALSRLETRDKLPALTARQREIGELVLRGLTNGEIASLLGISANTVKKHLKDLFLRQGISRRAELANLLR